MIRELLNKWFSLPDCKACPILERELAEVKRERDKLLEKLLRDKEPIIPIVNEPVEYKPIQTTRSRFMPAVVRQQMMDNEDRKTLQLMIDKKKELQQKPEQRIEELEKEIGVEEDASKIG